MARDKDVIDSTDPLYLHPSESVGSGIIPTIFMGMATDLGDMVTSWILHSLSRDIAMVTSWFLHSLSRDIVDSLQYVNNVAELWQELEDRTGDLYSFTRHSSDDESPSHHSSKTNYRQYNINTGNRSSQPHKGSSSGLRLFYDYCKKPGHIKDKCYKLYGFPPNFKFTKRKNITSVASVHTGSIEPPTGQQESTTSQDGAGGSSGPSNTLQHLTKEQHGQLMHLLESFHVGSTSEGSNTITSGGANFADSGALNHMTCNKNLLINIRPLPYLFLVTLPNSYRVKVTEIGDVVLNLKLTLHKAASMKRPMEIGKARNGLYYLCAECQLTESLHSLCSFPASLSTVSSVCDTSNGRSPNVLCYNDIAQAPSYFPSLVIVHHSVNKKPHKDKFEPRTQPHIFIGYPFGTKGYKVLDLATKKIHVSRDVQFYENIFPFACSRDHSSFPSILKHVNFRSTSGFSTDNILSKWQLQAENTLPSVPTLDTSPSSTTVIPPPHSPHLSSTEHIPPSDNQFLTTTSAPRRSSRIHTAPSHLQDFVYSLPYLKNKAPEPPTLSALFTNTGHIPLTSLHPTSQQGIQNISHNRDPDSYKEVIMNPSWQATMKHEWIYKIKHKADETVERFKERLVVKGYTQQAGLTTLRLSH
ncbi:hypothetical protein KY290_025087 [Solanum tuberosum]|uniref:Retroviral polymerase SH3-like domain-containing protein n=1 Tax=Solanum tuberosum TaxID=4113 RepID=A0ABQ7USI8_SOLTU|nr:hypothetical protein KY290_025087 [Solanum tuberosum]